VNQETETGERRCVWADGVRRGRGCADTRGLFSFGGIFVNIIHALDNNFRVVRGIFRGAGRLCPLPASKKNQLNRGDTLLLFRLCPAVPDGAGNERRLRRDTAGFLAMDDTDVNRGARRFLLQHQGPEIFGGLSGNACPGAVPAACNSRERADAERVSFTNGLDVHAHNRNRMLRARLRQKSCRAYQNDSPGKRRALGIADHNYLVFCCERRQERAQAVFRRHLPLYRVIIYNITAASASV